MKGATFYNNSKFINFCTYNVIMHIEMRYKLTSKTKTDISGPYFDFDFN